MTKPVWFEKARAVHAEFLRRAKAKGHLTNPLDLPPFFALAIAGEAGELANLYKKEWRGDAIDREDIPMEMADVRIYLEHLATELGADLDDACDLKLGIVEKRLNPPTEAP
jgi:NTP pyrophosphatase (non-canonical NTP hydrolase)